MSNRQKYNTENSESKQEELYMSDSNHDEERAVSSTRRQQTRREV